MVMITLYAGQKKGISFLENNSFKVTLQMDTN